MRKVDFNLIHSRLMAEEAEDKILAYAAAHERGIILATSHKLLEQWSRSFPRSKFLTPPRVDPPDTDIE